MPDFARGRICWREFDSQCCDGDLNAMRFKMDTLNTCYKRVLNLPLFVPTLRESSEMSLLPFVRDYPEYTTSGDVTKGELGFAAIPGAEDKFKDSINLAVKYAKALNCSRIHVMSGTVQKETEENAITYEKNLRHAVSVFEKENIVGLIEPINPYSVPKYYMNSYHKGLDLVKKVNSPNLKIMMDIFHLQHLHGNLALNIKEFLPYVGHIQVAQVPDRHEPNSSGEINYKYIFTLLEELGYDGWIGLEYKPAGLTKDGLTWVKELGQSL